MLSLAVPPEIKSILRRFQDHPSFDNKENHPTQTPLAATQDKNEARRQGRVMVESLITEGNQAFRYYQHCLRDALEQFEVFRQEVYNQRKAAAEQRRQAQKQIQQMQERVDSLNQQLICKSQRHSQLLEKYEEMEEGIRRVEEESHKEIALMQAMIEQAAQEDSITKASLREEIEGLKLKLTEAVEINEQLQNEAFFVKGLNQDLVQSLQYLKNKIDVQQVLTLEPNHEQQDQEGAPLFDAASLQGSEQKMTLQYLKMNFSNESKMPPEKQVLNVSEHYSKFNRTMELGSKQKPDYQLIIVSGGGSQSYKGESGIEADKKSGTSAHISQIKQFRMHDHGKPTNEIDPYRAFFTLLTQCEKMNHKRFFQVSNTDLSGLFDQLVDRMVPYNLWQREIRRALDGSCGQ